MLVLLVLPLGNQNTRPSRPQRCTPGFSADDICANRCKSEDSAPPRQLPHADGHDRSTCEALHTTAAWRGEWVQQTDGEGAAWQFDAPRCALPRSNSAASLRGLRLVMVGDCVMRYQYLSLVSFLESGSWGVSIVDPQTLEQTHTPQTRHNQTTAGTLPKSIAVGYSLARDPHTGKTNYARFYEQSNALLRGNEKCDCGVHDSAVHERGWLQDRYENRYYRNLRLNISVSFFFLKGKFSLHGHGSYDAWPPLRQRSTSSWQHYTLTDALHHVIRPLQPTVMLLNIGLWWFTNDFKVCASPGCITPCVH